MVRRTGPVFLERGSYRRRRMIDALRLIVMFGVCLWMIPVLWPSGPSEGAEGVVLSRALFYVFGVWIVLIVVSAVLTWRVIDDAALSGAGGEEE
ncbi:MAG: hypothetical protein AAGI36_04150 [Pseudomonadota bacterium]